MSKKKKHSDPYGTLSWIVLGFLDMLVLFYAVAFTLTLCADSFSQSYAGKCEQIYSRPLANGGKLYCLVLGNGDTVEISRGWLSKEIDRCFLDSEAPGNAEIEVSYMRIHAPFKGIFTRRYYLLSLRIDGITVIPYSCVKTQLVAHTVIYWIISAIFAVFPFCGLRMVYLELLDRKKRSVR